MKLSIVAWMSLVGVLAVASMIGYPAAAQDGPDVTMAALQTRVTELE